MGADVIAVTTRSREIVPEEAARRVALTQAALVPGMRLFKKVDSRLKGNIEAELSAIDFERALVLPAIPEFGRVVRNGMIDGFGVERPIRVAERLGKASLRSVIPDTETPQAMLAALENALPGDLLVGALSLAKAMVKKSAYAETHVCAALGQRLTMAIGSRDPITLAQIALLMQAIPDLDYLAAPAGKAGPDKHGAFSRLGAGVTLIQAVEGVLPASGAQVASALAETVARVSDNGDTLLLSGGATAEAFFDRQGISILRVVGEVLPGLPVAEHDGRFYITKSGGFGAPDTLLRLANAVAQGKALA
jgi:uncharacterized protein YgbK (DUF1537 family)